MIVGHKRVIEDFQRLADSGRLSHGYIFFGPQMVGKHLVAISLANYLENGKFEPLDESKVLSDAFFVKPDEGGSIGIDAMREIKYFLWQKPNRSSRRTVVIDRADALTTEAQNALLKITEEPPQSGLLFLVIKEPEMLNPTLRSRLQQIYFSNIPEDEIEGFLVKSKLAKAKEAKDLAKQSFGQPGRAISLLRGESENEMVIKARELMEASPLKRKDIIKNLLAKDTFSFRDFLDGMITSLVEDKEIPRSKIAFWHRLLEIRNDAQYVGLNPRLQIDYILNEQ